MEKSEPHPNMVLDVVIVGIAAALLLGTSKLGLEAGRPATKGAAATIGGVYVMYLGTLFLLSYFFPQRSFIFSFLSYVCQEHSHPRGKAMAWLYFGLSVLFGSALLLVGLGVL